MNLKSITGRSFLMAALIALPAASFAATRPTAAAREDVQTMELMKDLDTAAGDAADQASMLESATFSSNTSWEVHAQKLQALKDDVNEIGRIVSRLDEMRGTLSPADVDGLDRALALVKDMAANSQSAIQFLNADQQNFWMPAYRKNVTNLVSESAQLSSVVNRAIAHDKARAKEKR
jgi:hypothetical protein